MHHLSAAHHATIFANLDQGVIALDAALRVGAINDAALRFLNMDATPEGATISEAFAHWPRLVQVIEALATGATEIMAREPAARHFALQLVP